MNFSAIPTSNGPILKCGSAIERISDALEIVSACAEHRATKVLIGAEFLPIEFFQLSSRFAGEFTQKLANYRIQVGAVFDPAAAYPERFKEYLEEARRGSLLQAFLDEASALKWLES